MSREYYAQKWEEIMENSNSYERLESNNDVFSITKIKEFTSNFHRELTDQDINFSTQFQFDTSNFYGLPKIHKSNQITQAISNQKSALINISNPSDLKLRPHQ